MAAKGKSGSTASGRKKPGPTVTRVQLPALSARAEAAPAAGPAEQTVLTTEERAERTG